MSDATLRLEVATLLEMIAVEAPTRRAVLVVFDAARDDVPIVYSNAAAMDLKPALETTLTLVSEGMLRMPVDGGVRWVGEEEG